jgi:hypothetical protein
MDDTTAMIPGRRVTTGETFFTDWIDKGTADCLLLAAELLVKAGTCSVTITPQTRGEEDTSTNDVTATSPVGGLVLTGSLGITSCAYLAKANQTAGNGLIEQVRLKVGCSGGSAGDYLVIRVFPPIFFDSAVVY